MGKRNNLGLNNFAGVCAFIALVISGTSYLLARIFGGNLGALATVGNICLVISTIITAGLFINSSSFPWKGKFWIIIYWVFAGIAIVTLLI